MKLKLGTQWWTVRLVRWLKKKYGDCDHANREIRVLTHLSPRDELDTYIHEAIHAMCPWLREWMVKQCANELTALLFDKLEYRKR